MWHLIAIPPEIKAAFHLTNGLRCSFVFIDDNSGLPAVTITLAPAIQTHCQVIGIVIVNFVLGNDCVHIRAVTCYQPAHIILQLMRL